MTPVEWLERHYNLWDRRGHNHLNGKDATHWAWWYHRPAQSTQVDFYSIKNDLPEEK